LQGKDKLIKNMFDNMKTFNFKLPLCENQ